MGQIKEDERELSISLSQAAIHAQIAALYLRTLSKRPEIPISEKSELQSIITKIGNWLRKKILYVKVRHPHLYEKMEEDLKIDGDLVGDVANITAFLAARQKHASQPVDFIVSPASRRQYLRKYDELRAQGMTLEQAEKELFS